MARAKVFRSKSRQVALTGITVIALLCGAIPASAGDIHPLVATAAQAGRLQSVLLIMGQKADLSATGRLTAKAEKGAFVYSALRATANRTQPAALAQIRGMGLKATPFWIMNAIFVEALPGLSISPGQIQTLAANAGVLSIRPTEAQQIGPIEGPVAPPINAPILSGPTLDLSAIGAPAVWAKGFTGQGIVVGSSDTGVSLQPDLLTKYRGYAGPGKPNNDDYNWFDHSPSSACSSPCDTVGHGTHTTGTMVASNTSFQVGVAPGAKFIACRSLGPGDSVATVLACLQWFLAPTKVNGKDPDPSKAPDVTNNSYQCLSCGLEAALANLVAAGIAPVFANGNSGPGCRSVTEPADSPYAAGVGATNWGVPFNSIAFFSGRGPTSLNLTKPDLVAPGVNILSVSYTGGYVSMSGTSMAAPHVSGSIALLWSARPELHGNVAATLGLLAGTATQFVDTSCNILPYTLNVPNDVWGYGFIQVDKALASKWEGQ